MSSIIIRWPEPGQSGSRPREIAVLGAGGRTGRLVVERALAAGHLVTALVRRPESLPLEHPHLQVCAGDIFDPDCVGGVVQGRDAVIALLSPDSEKMGSFFYSSTTIILRAMANNGIRRFICVSSCAAHDAEVPAGITGKLRQPFQRHHALHLDRHVMEELVSTSPTNFLIARVVGLTDHAGVGACHTAADLPKGAKPVARADLADFLVRAAFDDDYRRASVVVLPGTAT